MYQQSGSEVAGDSSQEEGWALKTIARPEKMSENVKSFLTSKFREGAVTGHKTDPSRCVLDMKLARNSDGSKRFLPSEWRSAKQINNFFSRLASEYKKKGATYTPEEEEDDSKHVQEVELEQLRVEVFAEIDIPESPKKSKRKRKAPSHLKDFY